MNLKENKLQNSMNLVIVGEKIIKTQGKVFLFESFLEKLWQKQCNVLLPCCKTQLFNKDISKLAKAV